MKRISYIAPLLFALVGILTSLMAAVIALPPTAVSTSNGIKVTWTTDNETGVVSFDVLRSDTKTAFVAIKSIKANGYSSTYEFVDGSVFKTGDRVFVYKIQAVFSNAMTQESAPVTVRYGLSSTAKRTWGSIKAMFR